MVREKSQRSRGRGARAGQILPPICALSLFSTHSPIRLQMGAFFHQPNPFRRKKERKKTSGFRISLLSPEPLQWKVLPSDPVDVIAIIEDSRPPWGWTGPHSAIRSAKCKLLSPSDALAAASPPPHQPCRQAPRDARAARPRLVPLWLWELCLIKGSVLISVGPT